MWAIFVHSVNEPAAVVTADGSVIEANDAAKRHLNVLALPPVGSDAAANALPVGWSSKPLDHTSSYFLISGPVKPAVAESPEDVRDHLLRQFFNTDGVIFVVCSSDGRILQANHEWAAVLGQPSGDPGVAIVDDGDYRVPPADAANFWQLVVESGSDSASSVESQLKTTGSCEAMLRMSASDGRCHDIQWSISLDLNSGLLFGVGRDITAERTLTNELERMAFTDELTGLANRAELLRTITGHLEAGQQPAVLFCDLDRFKVVNDSLGHRAGDRLLMMLATRLTDVCSSKTRQGEVTVGRLGGDEFVAVLADADEAAASMVAQRMLEVIDRPFIIQGRSVRVGMSIGIAIAKQDGVADASALLGEADTGAYYAKDNLRGQFVVHNNVLQQKLDRRFNIEAGLISALAEDRFEVFYQPVVLLPEARIVGVEALVRWRDSEGILHMPGDFLDVAEEAGLIGDIGDKVLTVATSEISQLHLEGIQVDVAVNATAGQISSPSFVDAVAHALTTNGLDPSRLTVELTESAVLGNMEATIPVLNAIRELGVRIAVDDFGTGYSSLSYLQKLPIDSVKIDRSFVINIDTDRVTRSVVSAVMHLAEALDLSVVVEGIESVEQAAVVCELGGTLAQGFLFHEPLSRNELSALLATRTSS